MEPSHTVLKIINTPSTGIVYPLPVLGLFNYHLTGGKNYENLNLI